MSECNEKAGNETRLILEDEQRNTKQYLESRLLTEIY
jgi:hypothetical protein